MMNNPLQQLLLWISNRQKRKIQRIAHKLWEEDGFLKHPCPTFFPDNFNPKSHDMIPITNLNQLKEILEKYRQ